MNERRIYSNPLLGIRDAVKSTDFKFQKMGHEINYCTQIK